MRKMEPKAQINRKMIVNIVTDQMDKTEASDYYRMLVRIWIMEWL